LAAVEGAKQKLTFFADDISEGNLAFAGEVLVVGEVFVGEFVSQHDGLVEMHISL
jgi:hypothetical protein